MYKRQGLKIGQKSGGRKMKIRTEDELQDVIDSEIAWRKKELSAVKANI